jgi:patatin-related protein
VAEDGDGRGGVRELRLALVCYGGVSLAIYMHGVTKEIHKLVLASTAFEADPVDNPFPAAQSEHAYWNLLRHIADGELGGQAAGTSIRVVVDIVSGTSAGGINGIFLAKALAHNRSQDALRSLWFDKGDIKLLLRGSSKVPAWLRAGWMLRRPTRMRPPLRGDAMCQWLHGALSDMDDGDDRRGPATLVPPGHQLSLFVPITDFQGYSRDIPLHDPRFVRDETHRHVMEFCFSSIDESDFKADSNDMLAFAARATSSFPGAFPPLSVADYEAAVPKGRGLSGDIRRFFPLYQLSEADPSTTYFIDGGVLDNFPFGPSIDAISSRPAGVEVDRRLMYIEPDPGGGGVEPPAHHDAPGLFKTVLAGYASIPRQEPILDDLVGLAKRNESVLRLRDVIESSFESIQKKVEALLEEVRVTSSVPKSPTAADLAAFWADVQARALTEAGFSASTYVRLRVRSVVDTYATMVSCVLELPPNSWQSAFVTGALRRWAVLDGLLNQEQNDAGRQVQLSLLSELDLKYHDRRIRFLIAALNWMYRDAGSEGFPTRDQLDAGKRALYARLDQLHAIERDMATDPEVRASLQAIFRLDEMKTDAWQDEYPVETFVDQNREALAALRTRIVQTLADRLPPVVLGFHQDLDTLFKHFSAPVTGALLTRYVGFPFWDVLVFPLQSLSGAGERDYVEVYRMSPVDCTLLTPDPAQRRSKLDGMSIHHFGAFFKRSGREQDYLWGRLDAAERLVKLLLDIRKEPGTLATGAPGAQPPEVPPNQLADEAIPVFEAILAEEEGALPEGAGLVSCVRDSIAKLAAVGAPATGV